MSWEWILLEMKAGNKENIERLCGILIKNKKENRKWPFKVIKHAKASAWSKGMSLDVYEKQI